jgi:hypothetical protein
MSNAEARDIGDRVLALVPESQASTVPSVFWPSGMAGGLESAAILWHSEQESRETCHDQTLRSIDPA